jgi:hypothetical protein
MPYLLFSLAAEKITAAYHTILSELFQRDQEMLPWKWLTFTNRQKRYQHALKTLWTRFGLSNLLKDRFKTFLRSTSELLAQTRASDKNAAQSTRFLSHLMSVTSSTLGRAYNDDEVTKLFTDLSSILLSLRISFVKKQLES